MAGDNSPHNSPPPAPSSALAPAAPSPRRKSRGRRWLTLALVGGIVFGLGVFAAWWKWGGKKVWTDGQGVRVADAPNAVREIAWAAPRPLDGLNTADQEYEPSVSPDGSELYFVRGKAAKNADIYVSYRRGDAWTPPAPVEGVNSNYDDLGPRVTADNRFLLFYSNRPGGLGGGNPRPRTAPERRREPRVPGRPCP